MEDKKPTSFKVFIAVIFITALVFLTTTFCFYYLVNMKYVIILAVFQFIALAFTSVGIYTGFKYKTDENRSKIFNRIGLIGNSIIFLFTIVLMAYATMVYEK